jgi:hypothetical protein
MRTYYNDQPMDLDLSQIVAYRMIMKGIDFIYVKQSDIPHWMFLRESEAATINRKEEL